MTNNSQVYWLNLTSRKHGRLIDVDSVGSLAVDWIGQKLYWSNLKQQLVVINDSLRIQIFNLRIILDYTWSPEWL